MKITNQIIENHLNCPYKSWLTLQGEVGERHEYEALGKELADLHKARAEKALLQKCKVDSAPRIHSVTREHLRLRHPLILDCSIVNDEFRIHFDAIKLIEAESSSGMTRYQPVKFHHEANIREAARTQLAVWAHVLGQHQGDTPEIGSFVAGTSCRLTTTRINNRSDRVAKFLDELRQLREGVIIPTLRLNRHCGVCEFRQRCLSIARENNDLSLLRGMSDAEIEKHNSNGIFTVHQLSYTFRLRKQPKRSKIRKRPHYHALKALAIRENKLHVLGTPQLPDARTNVYVDMEGNENGRCIYLIGALVAEGENHRYHSFWADCAVEEPTIFKSFCALLISLKDPFVFHFGSYETRVFKRMLPMMPLSAGEIVSHQSSNILETVRNHLYFPTYSNGLKDIGAFLGCKWTEQSASGLQSLVWRHQWERSVSESLRTTLKETLVQYNYEDCLAVHSVVNCIGDIVRHTGEPHPQNAVVLDDDKSADFRNKFARKDYVVDGLASIVKAAYFDYQRHRVYVRTNLNFRKINRAAKKQKKRRNKPTKSVEFRAFSCVRCKSRNIVRNQNVCRSKTGIDLKIMETGIRRQITKYWHVQHRCADCGRTFIPPQYKRKNAIGHSILAWCVYQHVANRTTFEQLETTLADCFGVKLWTTQLHKFKGLAAKYYARTYKRLLRKIIAGELIHADETQITLQQEKGYVWIFASLEEVFYVYQPTRKADFLRPLLRGFEGVLVTDFYAGYDGLPCRQQKCLVHLIRDVNESLLKHPYDEELRGISMEFAEVMRDILKTVDRVGLRKSHLVRHEADVQKFFDRLRDTNFQSSIAVAFRKRLLKTRAELFEFLKHDGVPWNNNNAEHAVKHFAKYRRMVKGRLNAKGLSDYLVLLSLFETCRYKGISYFDFLLSRDRDLDHYCEQVW